MKDAVAGRLPLGQAWLALSWLAIGTPQATWSSRPGKLLLLLLLPEFDPESNHQGDTAVHWAPAPLVCLL